MGMNIMSSWENSPTLSLPWKERMNGIATMLAVLASHAACLGSRRVVLKPRNKSQDSPA